MGNRATVHAAVDSKFGIIPGSRYGFSGLGKEEKRFKRLFHSWVRSVIDRNNGKGKGYSGLITDGAMIKYINQTILCPKFEHEDLKVDDNGIELELHNLKSINEQIFLIPDLQKKKDIVKIENKRDLLKSIDSLSYLHFAGFTQKLYEQYNVFSSINEDRIKVDLELIRLKEETETDQTLVLPRGRFLLKGRYEDPLYYSELYEWDGIVSDGYFGKELEEIKHIKYQLADIDLPPGKDLSIKE